MKTWEDPVCSDNEENGRVEVENWPEYLQANYDKSLGEIVKESRRAAKEYAMNRYSRGKMNFNPPVMAGR